MIRKNPTTEMIVEFDATARRREKMKNRSRTTTVESKTVAAPVPQAPVASPAPAKQVTAGPEELRLLLMNFVRKNASLPIDEVDFDADLEGDYGVDWFKTGFLFDQLEERFEFGRPLERGRPDLMTLRQIMEYVLQRMRSTEIGAGPSKPATLDRKELESFLLAFVIEQTGYPEEIIQWDVDLEGELGLSSLKMTSLFGGLSEHFDIRIDPNMAVADYPTLRHVLEYLLENASLRVTEPPAEPVPTEEVCIRELPANETAVPVKNFETTKSSALDGDALDSFLINFVAEQTGYPQDMIQWDLDLEGDLGLSSLKTINLFAGLAEHFDIRIDPNLAVADFPTLRHVKDYLLDHATPLRAAPLAAMPLDAAPPQPAPQAEKRKEGDPETALVREEVRDILVSFIVEQTGYPEEIITDDSELERDLGIGSLKVTAVLAELAERYEIPVAEEFDADDYRTLADIVDYIVAHGKRKP